jgi:hypothetical protein
MLYIKDISPCTALSTSRFVDYEDMERSLKVGNPYRVFQTSINIIIGSANAATCLEAINYFRDTLGKAGDSEHLYVKGKHWQDLYLRLNQWKNLYLRCNQWQYFYLRCNQ